MRPLTLNCPKPLLQVRGQSLIEYHLQALAAAGITQVVINLAYLGEQIRAKLGSRYLGLSIEYSCEPEPLETGGAINHALALLGDSPFLLVNGDVWTDFSFASLLDRPLHDELARLVLVANPSHNPSGDFVLDARGKLNWAERERENTYTYAGIALISPQLIAAYPEARAKFPLREAFSWAIKQGLLSGELHSGTWCDVGTPERLAGLQNQ